MYIALGMHVLLSTIGSRGDVQPVLALALELRSLGHQARLCAPPDFRESVEGYGVEFVGVGPMVRQAGSQSTPVNFSPDAIRDLMRDTIAGQFATLSKAAEGCDVIVASTALEY